MQSSKKQSWLLQDFGETKQAEHTDIHLSRLQLELK